MNAHKINLDNIDPNQENITYTYNLLQNSMLSKLEKYSTIEQNLPSWVAHLKEQRWNKVTINPMLVFILSRKPINFEWKELRENINLNISLLPDKPDHTDNEIISFYNKSYEIHDKNYIRPWIYSREHINNKFIEAFKILEEIWSEAYVLVNAFVKKIVLVESPHFFSGSLPRFQGAILVSPQPHWLLAHYIECLVHEASHLELNIRRMIEPFITNAQEYAYSPLRNETRPLLGILHAAFVLCRTTEGLKRLELLPAYGDQAHKLLCEFLPALGETLKVLEKHAQFTCIGERLFVHMSEKAQKLERENSI